MWASRIHAMRRTLVALGLVLLGQGAELGAAAGLTPAPRVLIIHDTSRSWEGVRDSLLALGTPPAQMDFCNAEGTAPGMVDDLATCGYNVMDYCQVWDLRFRTSASSSGTTNWDTFTLANGGALDTDQEVYDNFVQNCGALMLLGENAQFASRNENLTQILSTWSTAGPVMYPYRASTLNVLSQGPAVFGDGFGTIDNALNPATTLQTEWPGLLSVGSIGSARRLSGGYYTSDTGVTDDMATAIGFKAADMPAAFIGRVAVAYDWQPFKDAYNGGPKVANQPYIQNLYKWLGNCSLCFRVAKVAAPPAPTPVALGSNLTYALCVTNRSAFTPIAAGYVLYDTFAPCLSYQSHSPAVASTGPTAGNYMTFSAPAIPVGSYFCVTVTMRADYLCP